MSVCASVSVYLSFGWCVLCMLRVCVCVNVYEEVYVWGEKFSRSHDVSEYYNI